MSEKTTILYVITSTNVGGTERALFELIKRIDRSRFNIHVCSLKKPGGFADRIKHSADGFYSLNLSESGGITALFNFPVALLSLMRLIHQIKPDIIHSFLFRANILARLAGNAAKVKNIICAVRVIEAGHPFKHLVDRLTSSQVKVYTAVSEAARDFTIKTLKLSPEKITTIQNGIDINTVCNSSPGDFTADGYKINIGLVGRLDKQKGHVILLKALKLLISEHQNLQIYFFGEGPEKQTLKTLVQKEQLNAYVLFMEPVEDIYSCISQMDMIVIPSLWEGLPNILLEAMALERPIIASRIDGITEVVKDKEEALLFEPGNEKQLAAATQTLIHDRALAQNIASKAKARVAGDFTMDSCVQKTEALYDRMLLDSKL